MVYCIAPRSYVVGLLVTATKISALRCSIMRTWSTKNETKNSRMMASTRVLRDAM
jgi:hypothetical protein